MFFRKDQLILEEIEFLLKRFGYKLSPTEEKIMQYLHDNFKYFDFVKRSFSDLAYLPKKEDRHIYHYFSAILNIIDNYRDIFDNEEESPFDSDWKFFCSQNLTRPIYEILRSSFSQRKMIKHGNERNYFSAKIDGIEFGFALSKLNDEFLNGYLEVKNNTGDYKNLIKTMIWQKYPKLYLDWSSSFGCYSFSEDQLGNFIEFKTCSKISEDLKKYNENGIKRSILIYGPPGTGKSNLVRGISHNVGGKNIRIGTIKYLQELQNIIDLLGPDSFIFEDIDRGNNYEASVLELFEKVNGQANVLATANYINQIDDALLRPGRFDELIEFKKMDEEVILNLVEKDSDLFDLTKEMPVACIIELMKRVKVFGKENAIQSSIDISKRLKKVNNANYELMEYEEDERSEIEFQKLN